MASGVDIANMALARLGDDASVSSLNPPEGSPQAQHCARFLPMARDTILQMHAWSFATRHLGLTQLVASPTTTWAYAYSLPAETLQLWAVLASDATDDLYAGGGYASPSGSAGMPYGVNVPPLGYTPQPFAIESDASAAPVVLTNQLGAVGKITFRVNDPARFPPLFVDALVWRLASFIAGPVLKGEAGAAATKSCNDAFMMMVRQAKQADAQQRAQTVDPIVPWIAAR